MFLKNLLLKNLTPEKVFQHIANVSKTIDDNIRNSEGEKRTQIIDSKPNSHHLTIYKHNEEKGILGSKTIYVYEIKDDNNNIVYYAKQNPDSNLLKIELYDSKHKKIGQISQVKKHTKNSNSIDSHYYYNLLINKKSIGEIQRESFLLGKDILTLNNYGIQAIKKGINYYVFYNSKNKSIGEKHNKFSYSLIIYKEKANELLYVMISLII